LSDRIWKVELATNTWTNITYASGPHGTGPENVYGLAVDESSNVYVTQNYVGGEVLKLATGTTTWTSILAAGSCGAAYGQATDSAGNLYLSSDCAVFVLPCGGVWQQLPASLPLYLYGIAADGAGGIYVTSSANSSITKLIQTPPAVTSTDPLNNAINMPPNGAIAVTFSDNIVPGTNFGSIALTTGGTPVSCSTGISGKTLTITPTSDLTGGASYTVAIPAGAVSFLTPLTGAYSFSFTAATPTTPTVAASGPSALTGTTAVLNGSITADGGLTLLTTVSTGAPTVPRRPRCRSGRASSPARSQAA
jgi:hypothetical protein